MYIGGVSKFQSIHPVTPEGRRYAARRRMEAVAVLSDLQVRRLANARQRFAELQRKLERTGYLTTTELLARDNAERIVRSGGRS